MRALLSLTTIATLAAGSALLADDWPTWRGPNNNSVSTETNLPTSWGAKCVDAEVPPAISETPDGAAAAQQGRGRGGGRGGGQEGRPLLPFVCNNLQTENVAWKIGLPAF